LELPFLALEQRLQGENDRVGLKCATAEIEKSEDCARLKTRTFLVGVATGLHADVALNVRVEQVFLIFFG